MPTQGQATRVNPHTPFPMRSEVAILALSVALLPATAAAAVGGDPLRFFKTDASKEIEELERWRDEYNRNKLAAQQEQTESLDAKAPVTQRSKLAIAGRLRPPLAVTAVGSVGWQLWHRATAWRLAAAVQHEWQSLVKADPTTANSAATKAARPKHTGGSKAAHRRLLLELRRRRAALDAIVGRCDELGQRPPPGMSELGEEELERVSGRLILLAEHVLPAYRQLDEKPQPNLCWREDAELSQLNATLAERVRLCAVVIDGYERLGQDPPPQFRSWRIDRLQARATNLTVKAPLLRRVVMLQSQLGQKRMDWELPSWSEAELERRCEVLAAQVQESHDRREKEVLMGQAEAAHWLRKEEPPFGLAAMSPEELRKHIETLKGSAQSGPSALPERSDAGNARASTPSAQPAAQASKGE